MAKIYSFIIITLLSLSSIFVSDTAVAQSSENRFSINNNDMKMTIYPVPATSYVNIYLSPALRQVTEKVEIINITGRVVLEQRLISNNTSEVSFNNIANQPAGVYIITSKDKEGKILQSGKMIIKK